MWIFKPEILIYTEKKKKHINKQNINLNNYYEI